MAQRSRQLEAGEVATEDATQRTIIVKTERGRELRIRSHQVAQVVAGVLAATIAAVTVLWFLTARAWWEPCGDFLCEDHRWWFRWPQMSLATVGLLTGLTISLYLARFAAVGRIWRRSRELSLLHGAVVLAWLVLWTVAALTR